MAGILRNQNGMNIMISIGTEEQQLTECFGREYEDYMARVDRLVPFRAPSRAAFRCPFATLGQGLRAVASLRGTRQAACSPRRFRV